MRIHFHLLFASSFVALASCTSSSFDVAPTSDDGGVDTGAIGDGGSVDAVDAGDTGGAVDAVDASGPDTGVSPGDVGPLPDGTVTCTPLAAGATDLYVDKRLAGAVSNGTEGCPFTTITAAIAGGGSFTGTRTIHVAGAVVPVVYNESSSITVNHNVVLLGDGPARTTINASGPCLAATTCAVSLVSGATLDGFTVVSAAGDGIATAIGVTPPVVRNVNANGSKLNGINVFGSIELGPNVSVNRNGLQGVNARAAGVVHVISGVTVNTFDNNGVSGLDIEGGATLKFDGGTANTNGTDGIRIAATTAGTSPSHIVTGLSANGNGSNGLGITSTQNVKVRGCKLLGNLGYGIYFASGGSGALDLGTTADPGANTFGVNTPAKRNVKAGIFVCKSRGADSLAAEGNTWSSCPPSQLALASCDTPGIYADLAYMPAVIGDPMLLSSCMSTP